MARLERSPIAERQLSGEAGGAIIPQGLASQELLAQSSFMGRAADLLNARAAKMQEEKDVLDAVSAKNIYQDKLRSSRDTIFSIKGKDASGMTTNEDGMPVPLLYKDARKYIAEEKIKINQNLTPGAQRRFEALTQSDDENYLDNVSRHLAKEQQQYKEDVLLGRIERAKKNTSENPAAFDHEMSFIDGFVDNQFPGRDMKAFKSDIREKMRGEQLDSMINADIGAARTYIENNKDISDEMKSKYLSFIDKQIKMKLVEIERQAVEETELGKNNETENFYQALNVNKYQEAQKILEKSKFLSEKEKYTLENAIDTKIETGRDPFKRSDPGYFDKMLDRAVSGQMTETEILSLRPIPNKLSRSDYQMIKTISEERLKETDKNYKDTVTRASASIKEQIYKGSPIEVEPQIVEWNFQAQHDLFSKLSEEKDKKKRMEMLDPSSENYVIPRIVSKYKFKDMTQAAKSYTKKLGMATEETQPAPVAPGFDLTKRMPNETIDEYEKRMKVSK